MNENASQITLRRLVWFILAAALVLRLWGITYGLPQIYMTDEWFEVKRALKLGAGVFDIDRVGKGGYYYLLFVVFGFYYAVLRIFGAVGGSEEFLLSIFRDPTGLWLVGRTTTVLIGVLTVGFIYRAGRGLQDRAVGLVAAALLAIHVMHTRSSRAITVDVPLVCLLTAGFAMLYRWQDRDDLGARHYALLGLVTAAATATKLPGAVFVVSVLVFHSRTFRRSDRPAPLAYLMDRRLWAYVLVGAATYVAMEPGIVIHIGGVLRWVLSFAMPAGGVEAGSLAHPLDPGRFDSIAGFYASQLFPAAYTVLPLLFLGGVAVAVRRHGLIRQPGLFFVILFGAFLIRSKDPLQVYARYLLPILPIVLLYSALGLVELYRALASRHRAAALLAPALGLLVAVPMIADTVRTNISLGWPDTRTQSKDWIESNIPEGAAIYLAGGLVRPSAITAQLRLMPELVERKVGQRLDDSGQEMTGEKSRFYEVYKRAMSEYHPTYDLILLDDQAELLEALEEDRGDWALMVAKLCPVFRHQINRESFPGRWRLCQKIEAGEFVEVQRFLDEEGMSGPPLILYRKAALEAPS